MNNTQIPTLEQLASSVSNILKLNEELKQLQTATDEQVLNYFGEK